MKELTDFSVSNEYRNYLRMSEVYNKLLVFDSNAISYYENSELS